MIIGLTGFKQAGKSTVAEYLEDNYSFVRINFKDALVADIKKRFPDLLITLADIYHTETIDDLFTIKPPAVRKLMQNYGTDVRRADELDYWVSRWRVAASSKPDDNIAVDDVRFLNEAYAIRDMGGIIIRVVMEDQEQNDQHKSELEHLQIDPDFTITAVKGDHAHVYRQVETVIDTIRSNVD